MTGQVEYLTQDAIGEPHGSWRGMPEIPRLKRSYTTLLKALSHAHCGGLKMTLPDGALLHYHGAERGETAHIHILDWKAFDQIIARGQLGFADAYIDGQIESDDLAGLVAYFLRNEKSIAGYFHGRPWYTLWTSVRYALHANNKGGSRKNVAAHYDLGNAFYALWLDESMTYSSALFSGDPHRTLAEAQAAKYRRILDKLNAEPDAHILEIGCGWGGFAEAAARRGLRVTGVTLSAPQAEYAIARMKKAGLSDRVTIEVADYRDVKGAFDHVVSIGMFEHVGADYWDDYFRVVKRRLKPFGRAMIQSIYVPDATFRTAGARPGFIELYIFPGGQLPSPEVFKQRAEAAGLVCKEQFAFGFDYRRTLENWRARFESKLAEVRALGHDERFIRLWRLYLNACIAAFATQRTGVMQAELMIAGFDRDE